ncbi:unnamed protein product, partial [Linum tenue]
YQLSTVFLLFFSSTGFAGGTLDWRRNFFTISTSPGSSSHTPPSPTNLSRWIVKLSQNLPPMESPSPPLEILEISCCFHEHVFTCFSSSPIEHSLLSLERMTGSQLVLSLIASSTQDSMPIMRKRINHGDQESC